MTPPTRLTHPEPAADPSPGGAPPPIVPSAGLPGGHMTAVHSGPCRELPSFVPTAASGGGECLQCIVGVGEHEAVGLGLASPGGSGPGPAGRLCVSCCGPEGFCPAETGAKPRPAPAPTCSLPSGPSTGSERPHLPLARTVSRKGVNRAPWIRVCVSTDDLCTWLGGAGAQVLGRLQTFHQ